MIPNARKMLNAPCRWCGYNGPSYWQENTHEETCPWRSIGGETNRLAALLEQDVAEPVPASGPREFIVPPTTAGGNETVVREGIYISRKPFSDLRGQMSPESQQRAADRTQAMSAEIDTAASGPREPLKQAPCSKCRKLFMMTATHWTTCPECRPVTAADEEMVPHLFVAMSTSDDEAWCSDCEYHRDHAIHSAAASGPREEPQVPYRELRELIERVRVECSQHRDNGWVSGAVYALDTLKQRLVNKGEQ